MVDKFDKKAAEKAIKDIKNKEVNPFYNKLTGSKTYTSSENKFTLPNTLKTKAAEGYQKALKIEEKAKDAGVTLDKDAMRRLDKIKTVTKQPLKKMDLSNIKVIKYTRLIRKRQKNLEAGQKQQLKNKDAMIIKVDSYCYIIYIIFYCVN